MTAAKQELGPWRAIVPGERIAEASAQLARDGGSPQALDELWESLGPTPLWEPDPELPGAWRATFLWRGAPAQTHHVSLCGPIVFSEPFGCPLERIPASDVWHLTLRLPAGTRSAYMLSADGVLHSDDELGELGRIQGSWVRDPLNPLTLVVPENAAIPEYTPRVYSVAQAPDAAPQPWSTPQAGVARGRVDEHAFASALLRNERRVWTYEPAGRPPAASDPLLVVFDGWDAVNVLDLPVVLDNLIAAGRIPPLAAVMVDVGTFRMRLRELDCHEPFLAFLTDELLPWAADRWGLALDRSRTLVAGASLGGRAALFAALRRPDVFGKAIAQSAAETVSCPSPVTALARRTPVRAEDRLDVYMDAGLLEIDPRDDRAFLPGARHVSELLNAAGHRAHFVELACGHDELVWRESFAHGLMRLLPAAPRLAG